MQVTLHTAPRGALFQAALALLDSEPDPLARLMLLRDAFPKASLEDIQRTLRETACLFHVYGIRAVRSPTAHIHGDNPCGS